MQKCRKIPKN